MMRARLRGGETLSRPVVSLFNDGATEPLGERSRSRFNVSCFRAGEIRLGDAARAVLLREKSLRAGLLKRLFQKSIAK